MAAMAGVLKLVDLLSTEQRYKRAIRFGVVKSIVSFG
jgi:hypothetical protein